MARPSAAFVFLASIFVSLTHDHGSRSGGVAAVATTPVDDADAPWPAGERDNEEAAEAEEFWLDDYELEYILSTLKPGHSDEAADPLESPRLSLEEQIEMVLEDKFQRQRGRASAAVEEEEEEDRIGGYLKGETARDGDERSLRKDKRKANKGRGKKGGKKAKNTGKGKQPVTKTKRGNYNAHKFGNSYHTNVGQRHYRNVCLEPPDRYRTCFARAVDPSNDLAEGSCDKINRNAYNLGAMLYKEKREIPEGLPVPYTAPYVQTGQGGGQTRGRARAGGELRTEGRMHLSLFQVSKKVSGHHVHPRPTVREKCASILLVYTNEGSPG